ncbi:hypothetical protein J3458_001839 [Metarhizium acridum]|uniref:uncharacterized protein n=1 Tax=Metarhizium acridum TaxID=92637 RepID=UPI001C6D2265|nr:hypothetical protein J3458_001839 [Metarhizium acridum]
MAGWCTHGLGTPHRESGIKVAPSRPDTPHLFCGCRCLFAICHAAMLPLSPGAVPRVRAACNNMLTKNSSKGVGDDADLVRLGQVVDRRGPIMRQRGPSLAARWSAIEYCWGEKWT